MDHELSVFTRQPYGIYGISHIYVSKENILVDVLLISYFDLFIILKFLNRNTSIQ